jgi:hypothetical protein
VHWGSRGRGGWAYQTLAIGLTYMAIVSAYVPMIVTELIKRDSAAESQAVPQDDQTAADTASNATPAATEPATAEVEPAGLGTLAVTLGALLLIACAAPFLAGIQNVIGIIIIGIGMYEAWKLNKRVPLVITGPHALALAGPATIGQ